MKSPYFATLNLAVLLCGFLAPATLHAADCVYTTTKAGSFSCSGSGFTPTGMSLNATCEQGDLCGGGDCCMSCGGPGLVSTDLNFSRTSSGNGFVEAILDGVSFRLATVPGEPAEGVAQRLADLINNATDFPYTAATAGGPNLRIIGARTVGVRILDPGLNNLANVPDGAQTGMTTTGALRQLVPALSPGQLCTVSVWVGNRSDGGGNGGSWYLQLTNAGGTLVWTILSGMLSAQSVEWQQYQKSFRVPPYFAPGSTLFQITGYSGFESYDLIELDCGGGNLLVNGSFENPAIRVGQWSPAFFNPPPAFWQIIPGAGHFNPSTTQFKPFFQ